jgi:hypothetical protein
MEHREHRLLAVFWLCAAGGWRAASNPKAEAAALRSALGGRLGAPYHPLLWAVKRCSAWFSLLCSYVVLLVSHLHWMTISEMQICSHAHPQVSFTCHHPSPSPPASCKLHASRIRTKLKRGHPARIPQPARIRMAAVCGDIESSVPAARQPPCRGCGRPPSRGRRPQPTSACESAQGSRSCHRRRGVPHALL